MMSLFCSVLIGLFCCFCFSSFQIKKTKQTTTKTRADGLQELVLMILYCWVSLKGFLGGILRRVVQVSTCLMNCCVGLISAWRRGCHDMKTNHFLVPSALTSDQISLISLIMSGFHPFFHPSLRGFLLTWVFYFNLIHRVCLQQLSTVAQ